LTGLFFKKVIFPQLGNNLKIPIIQQNIQVNDTQKRQFDITYILDSSEIIDFHLYSYEHSPQRKNSRKVLRRLFVFIVFLEIITIILIWLFFGKQYLIPEIIICGCIVLTLLCHFVSTIFLKYLYRRLASKEYSKGRIQPAGKHNLSITQYGISDRTDKGESVTGWFDIKWILSTDEHLYLTATNSSYYIVPHRAFPNEEAFRECIRLVKVYHQAEKSK
jgi:hypothetical protein